LIPGEAKVFSLLQRFQKDPGANLDSYSVNSGDLSQRGKAARSEDNLLAAFGAEFRKEWS
jgi:hypothetical protein